MEESRFIHLLHSLGRRQQRRYLEFLHSPYFNKHEDVTRFAGLMVHGEYMPGYEAVFKALYPAQPFSHRRIHDLMYKSLKLLEQFLAAEQYTGQPWQQKLNILSFARENNIPGLNTAIDREITELRNRKQLRDSEYFFEEFMYQSEADKIFLNQARIQGDESLQKKVDQLDLFYLSARLRDNCEMMNRKMILNADYDFNLLQSLMDAIRLNFEKYAPYPAITLYYRIMLLLQNPADTALFFTLKDEIYNHVALFSEDEQRSLYGYLQNYCIHQLNAGKAEFSPELLNIYRHMFDRGLMNAANKNLQWDLKNMVSTALRLGEYDWTYHIIKQIKEYLPEDVRENAYNYNLANYYYETKDFSRAKKLLQTIEFTDVYYNLGSKSMLLKIYFEQEEEEAFYSFAASFKAYLTRNKLISKENFTIYNNLVRFSRLAFVHKTALPFKQKKNIKKIEALKSNILETRTVANLPWLVKEIDTLLSGI